MNLAHKVNQINEVNMAVDEKHKQVNLDIDTYNIIKSNALMNHRSIAGEIRQMLFDKTILEKSDDSSKDEDKSGVADVGS
jgi:hypothetical protein